MGDYSTHFNKKEIECKCGCGMYRIEYRAMSILEALRRHFGKPFSPNCGCRCKKHNKEIGGSTKSGHLIGSAFDIAIPGITPSTLAEYLETLMPDWGGIIIHETFVHFDTKDRYFRDSH